MDQNNPVGLTNGIEFIEFCGPDHGKLEMMCKSFGLVPIAKHKNFELQLFRQNDINFLINDTVDSFQGSFKKLHGPSVCATGFRVKDAKFAFEEAVRRGARPFTGDKKAKGGWDLPAIYGIGDSLIFFVDKNIYDGEFNYTTADIYPKGLDLLLIDHMTNNVPKGEMQKWCDFYEKIFGFKEKRYFDIRGKSTGLISKVMRSHDGKICIPINEPADPKSQIQEYLDEYKGSGIQHIAFLSDNICDSVPALRAKGIEFLAAPLDTYYQMLPDRVPTMKEDISTLKKHAVLADGDREGYLLQIFTKNQCGPVFIEIIQRRNHFGFGDGNFQALFDAMEADQRARGVL